LDWIELVVEGVAEGGTTRAPLHSLRLVEPVLPRCLG